MLFGPRPADVRRIVAETARDGVDLVGLTAAAVGAELAGVPLVLRLISSRGPPGARPVMAAVANEALSVFHLVGVFSPAVVAAQELAAGIATVRRACSWRDSGPRGGSCRFSPPAGHALVGPGPARRFPGKHCRGYWRRDGCAEHGKPGVPCTFGPNGRVPQTPC